MNLSKQNGGLLLLPAALLAVAIVFGLLLLMKTLITQNLEEPDTERGPQISDIWQQDQELEDQVKERKIEEIDQPDEPPPEIPRQDIEIDSDIDAVDISTGAGTASINISLGGGFSDGDIIPLVAIQPQYPRRAAERGIEGHVIVSFVITTVGTTRDIVVEETTNRVFNRSAIRAAERLKYKPRIIDGTPVEVEHFYKFTYELADG